MIGKLFGQLVEKNLSQVLVDVAGVGYEVQVPLTTFYRLPEVDEKVTLHIHLVVREDAHLLYGFCSKSERDLFRTLIKVNGVGPKLGLNILSGIDAPTLAESVRNNDVKTLVSLPGVGRKTAEKLIIEMRDRLKEWEQSSRSAESRIRERDMLEDAETALIGLGFKPQDAARALAQVEPTDDDVEDLIKQALRVLSS